MPGQRTHADSSGWTRRRFRAPKSHGELLAVPPLGDCREAAVGNRELLGSLAILREPLSELRLQARAEVLAAAGESGARTKDLWFVAGHQPSLFHPGVWVKNFAASALARQSGGVGLNLVVDNDTLAVPGVLVPARTRDSPSVETLLFDAPRAPETWEEAQVRDRGLFESFGERAVAALRPWGFRPLAETYWRDVLAASAGTPRLADCLTQARAACERGWGFGNVEFPISRMCETRSFRRFASHLLHELPRFHELHNRVLDEYRARNRVRSRTHPVPDLRVDGVWQEAPFWIWRAGESGRRRVLVSRSDRGVLLSDGASTLATLPHDAGDSLAELERLSDRGWRLRSRALTTTLFARLFLADLFLHGIGGAKYDEMTDQLITRFYGLTPPAFLTLSGTLHLPLGAHPVGAEDNRRLAERLRALAFHPARFLSAHDREPWEPLFAEQASLIAEQFAVRQARQERRHDAPSRGLARKLRFQQLRSELAPATQALSARWQAERDSIERQLRANAVLANREYASVLFPMECLKEMLGRWSTVPDGTS